MPRAYSLDRRERALRALDAGHPAPEVAAFLGVSQRTRFRWRARQRAGQSLAPRRSPGQPPKIGPAQHDARRAQIATHPDATLAQHVARWQAATGVGVGIATMARTIAGLGLTVNKSPPRGRTRCGRARRLAGRGPNMGPGRSRLRR